MKNFFAKIKALTTKAKKVNVYKNKTIFFIVPLVVILVMLICGLCFQFTPKYKTFANIGIDFRGGTKMTVIFKDSPANEGDRYNKNVDIIREVLKSHDIELSGSRTSGTSSIIVQYINPFKDQGADDAKAMNDLNQAIKDELMERSAAGTIDKIVDITDVTIGNTSSTNLLKTAAIAVAVALACMLLYIIIRFDLYSALATIVALLHDLIIMLSLTIIFRVEIGSSIVAALITIVAYSINNTIVVFDKIRTIIKPYKQSKSVYKTDEVVNDAIFGTMTRTIYTTFTTIIVMVVLVAIGVESIQTFGLPIIFGLIAGFYSSVFIAAPLWADFKSLGGKISSNYKNRKYKKAHAK